MFPLQRFSRAENFPDSCFLFICKTNSVIMLSGVTRGLSQGGQSLA